MNGRVVQRKPSLHVGVNPLEIAAPERGCPCGVVRLKFQPHIHRLFRHHQQALAQAPGCI
jgi:hypothetical protein